MCHVNKTTGRFPGNKKSDTMKPEDIYNGLEYTTREIMAKYILSKKAKGKKYQYTVTDEKGNVVSTRTSACDYVACTANGEFYFGRLDLIGKGDHGKGLSRTTEILANPERAYKKQVADFVPSFRKEWRRRTPPTNGLPAMLIGRPNAKRN